MRVIFLLFASIPLVVAPAYASDIEPALCASDEKVIFSCQAKHKVISLCSSGDLSQEAGEVTYRYGALDNKPELEYSSRPGRFDDYFKYSYSDYPKGSTCEVSFEIGKYTYTVHQDLHVYRPDSAGVFVEKGSKIVAHVECDNPTQRSDIWSLSNITAKENEPRYIGTLGP